jgi:hypothetical protein
MTLQGMRLLRLSSVTVLALVLNAALAAAAPPRVFLDTDFGPPEAGLRLAVTIDSAVPPGSPAVFRTSAMFRIKNTGKRPVRFATEYSCSGLSPFSISMGMTEDALDLAYAYEPRVKGLARKLATSCTVNVPTKFVTIGAGKVVAIPVPFANNDEIFTSKETTFRASAVLHLEGRATTIVLRSPIAHRAAP